MRATATGSTTGTHEGQRITRRIMVAPEVRNTWRGGGLRLFAYQRCGWQTVGPATAARRSAASASAAESRNASSKSASMSYSTCAGLPVDPARVGGSIVPFAAAVGGAAHAFGASSALGEPAASRIFLRRRRTRSTCGRSSGKTCSLTVQHRPKPMAQGNNITRHVVEFHEIDVCSSSTAR